jgi:hypothetical protein
VQATLYGARDGYVHLYPLIRTTTSAQPVLSLGQQNVGVGASAARGIPVMVNITDLQPYTNYDIYCAVSSQGIVMQLPAVLTTKQSVRTKCCKTVTLTVLHPPTVRQGEELSRAIVVTLDAPPSTTLAISVKYAVQGGPAVGVALMPSLLRYDNRSVADTGKDVRLTALASGNYTVQASVSGLSADEYSVVFRGTTRLTVPAADALPPAPQLVEAVFSNDGGFVTLSFDSATDQGSQYGTFPCRALLRFTGDSNAGCQWYSASQLRIYPAVTDTSTAVGVRSNTTMLPNKVRARCVAARCATYAPVAATTVLVSAPSNPAVPSVVVSVPSSISGCNSLNLDLAGSVGAAGRPWSSVVFAVSTVPPSASAADRLQQFLSRNYTLSPPLPVPNTVLTRGFTYAIKVTLCNFLMACGSATKSVLVSESTASVPVVTIAGQPTRTMYRAESLSVAADAYTQSCDGVKSSAGLQYSWAVTQQLPGASTSANVTLRTTSQSPAVYKLLPFTLSVGSAYTITASVISTPSGKRSSAAFQVRVLQSQLVAVLKGGSTRYSTVGAVLTLDASSSYDKDYPQVSLASGAVSYTWSCLTVAPTLSAECAVTLVDPGPGHASRINVTSTYMALNSTSVVSVTVSDGSRSSTAQVRIIILQAPSPRLSITAVGSTDNVNTGKPFTLLGSLYLQAPCTAAWSVNDPTIALAAAARTPVQQYMLPAVGSAEVPFNLVIQSDALPPRTTLQFTLSCGSTTAFTVVTTNGAPLPGSFTVTPSSGIELATVFTFAAAQWSDPDLPLTYQFGFHSAVSLSNLVIVARSELTHASSSLPAGDASRADAVDCSLRVFDSLGASTDTALTVTVNAQIDADQASQLVLQLLKSSGDTVQGVKTALAVGSGVLNSVNCTLAPNCAPLNRNTCRMTSGQCGACLDGFAGDAGDRNTLCVALTASPLQLAATKDCAYNCSGHGECLFVDQLTGTPLSKCTLADAYCEATCACTDDYSGQFCEIDAVTLRRRREVRSNLILSLSILTRQDDISTESLSSWSANLYALSIRPHEVSQEDANVLADIANTTLHHAIALGADSYADMLGVLQATDAVASLLRYNYNPNDYRDTDFNTSRAYVNNTAARFIPIVSTFADMVSRLKVLGENATDIVYDNFRMSVALSDGGQSQKPRRVPVASQQDAAEASSVTLHPIPGGVAPPLSVTVISTPPRSYTTSSAQYVSSPVRLQVQAVDAHGSRAVDYLSSIEFTFQHNEPQHQYVHYEEHNFNTTCTAQNASQTFTYHCPDSGYVIRHNCSQGAGVHVSYCPRPAASCAMLVLDTAEITPAGACRVLSSTATHTTCSCLVDGSQGSSRRLLTEAVEGVLDDTGTANMVITTVYIASSFADTFHSADALNDTSFERVLVMVLMLGGVWLVGAGSILVEWVWTSHRKHDKKVHAAPAGVESALTYIESVIPKVFERGASSWRRLVMEIAQHHMLFELLAADSAAERRMLVMRALTDLNAMFFLTAAFFDISQPSDDGSCAQYTAVASCLARRCAFDHSQTYCVWSIHDAGTDVSDGRCVYSDKPMSLTALFYLTVLTTVIGSLLAIPVSYLFATLKAPTAISLQGSKVSAMVGSVIAGVRRVSNVGLDSVASGVRRVSNIGVNAGQLARIAPAPAPKRGLSKKVSSMFFSAEDGVIANREIPDSIAEASAAARSSIAIINKNASAYAKAAEGAGRSLRARTTRVARRTMVAALRHGSVPKQDGGAVRIAEPTTLTTAGTSTADSAEALIQDVVHQRLLMNNAAVGTALYDAQWGVVPDGYGGYAITPQAVSCIAAAVKESSKEATDLDEVLENYTVQHAGLEMLHLFMLDLLGRKTIAAKVFREKFGEEFGHSRVVVRSQKYFAVIALLGLNAFFIYYVLLRAAVKGRTWQYQFALCCAVQFVVDILIFETVECTWLNFLVPQYVHNEVARAAEILRMLTRQITRVSTDTEVVQPAYAAHSFVNAPPHLFVSVKLARMRPQLLESMIVGSYRHHLPGEICKTWPHSGRSENSTGWAWPAINVPLPRSVMRGLALSLQLFIGVPFIYQRVVLRLVQPVVFSGMALLFHAVVHSKLILALVSFGVVVCIVGAVLVTWLTQHSATPTSVTPLEQVEEEAPAYVDESSDSEVDFSVVLSSESGWTNSCDYKSGETESSERHSSCESSSTETSASGSDGTGSSDHSHDVNSADCEKDDGSVDEDSNYDDDDDGYDVNSGGDGSDYSQWHSGSVDTRSHSFSGVSVEGYSTISSTT